MSKKAGREQDQCRSTVPESGNQFRDFLPYPQDQRRLPTVLSPEEVSRLINAAGTLFRRTLLMTLYSTGMRRSELAHLKVGDVETYSVNAYILFLNGIVDERQELMEKTLPKVKMPNRDGFVPDPCPDIPFKAKER